MSFGKALKPKLLLVVKLATCMAAAVISDIMIIMNEGMRSWCKVLEIKALYKWTVHRLEKEQQSTGRLSVTNKEERERKGREGLASN